MSGFHITAKKVFMSKRSWTAATTVGFLAIFGVLAVGWNRNPPIAAAQSAVAEETANAAAQRAETGNLRVQVVRPANGGVARTTCQPGSVYAFESAALFAKVSGYLKNQAVDIGDKVKRGDVLAEIDAPELDLEVAQSAAAIAQAKAEVDQMKAHLVTHQADWQTAIAAVTQAEAELGRATAQRSFHEKQYQRIKKLYELNSVDERLVDEKLDEMEASQAAERAAQAAIVTAKAKVAAAAAKVEEARSDILAAEAKVQMSQAAMDKAKVLAEYKKIVSPYDGVVTKRSYNRGDFIRTAERSGEPPLLVVERTDRLRVVVQVPDLDVPWIEKGNPATVEIDALPGEMFQGAVARIADAEDSQTRTMRVEIDLPNDSGRLRQGMYGRVMIKLRAATGGLVIPATCLVGQLKDGKGSVYVVREGKACLVAVKIGSDDGAQLEIRQGLAAEDEVVVRHNGAIGDGVPVVVVNGNQS